MQAGNFVRPMYDENIVGKILFVIYPDDELPKDLQVHEGERKQVTYRDRDRNCGIESAIMRARVEWERCFGAPGITTIQLDRLVNLEPHSLR